MALKLGRVARQIWFVDLHTKNNADNWSVFAIILFICFVSAEATSWAREGLALPLLLHPKIMYSCLYSDPHEYALHGTNCHIHVYLYRYFNCGLRA